MVQRGEVSVIHNGVLVIDKGTFDTPTVAGPFSNIVSTGPILLQDHGSAVRFRNLKIKERIPSVTDPIPVGSIWKGTRP